MSSEITPAATYVGSIKKRYPGLDFPSYKQREWFSKAQMVFFDCEVKDKESCLENILKQTNLEAFIIFIVIKGPNGAYKLTDVSFRNLGAETLARFIDRYHQQLESMTRLSLRIERSEYIECIGYSYTEGK